MTKDQTEVLHLSHCGYTDIQVPVFTIKLVLFLPLLFSSHKCCHIMLILRNVEVECCIVLSIEFETVVLNEHKPGLTQD